MDLGTYSLGTKKGFAARKTVVATNFRCVAPHAKTVFLAGDFNDWQPRAQPMRRQPDGAWLAQIQLNHGHHHYHFLVDGKPVLDPRAHGTVHNERNEKVSLICVS